MLKANNFTHFDHVHLPQLTRSVITWNIMAEELNLHRTPVHKAWRLNERHFGSGQGLSIPEIKEKWGAEELDRVRQNWDHTPPAQDKSSQDYLEVVNDPAYRNLPREAFPVAESME
jgi:2,3-bisphosphoglycerate-dependent phosphoglycerate mutase